MSPKEAIVVLRARMLSPKFFCNFSWFLALDPLEKSQIPLMLVLKPESVFPIRNVSRCPLHDELTSVAVNLLKTTEDLLSLGHLSVEEIQMFINLYDRDQEQGALLPVS